MTTPPDASDASTASTVLTAGVDLAAEPKGTALAVIEWASGRATLTELQLGVEDALIVDVAGRVAKVGIDCAFGWPAEFVDFVASHSVPPFDTAEIDGGMDWRRRLSYRETDRAVRELTGRWPLSVSTDRLGLTAMRCAGLLSRIQASGIPVDRAGSESVVEVYPGASLRLWGFETTGYRASAEARGRLLEAVTAAAPWLDLGAHEPLMVASGDAFDAVIAALAARSAAQGNWVQPTPTQLGRARSEGWIALPTGPLIDLVG